MRRMASITRSTLGGALLGSILGLGAFGPAWADTIHLKNGSTISGIVDQAASDKDRVIIKTTTGTIPVHRSKIDRIETRANMTNEEQRGDLAMHAGEIDRALALYLAAVPKDPESKELEKKIADTRQLIKERDDKRFGQQFERIDKLIEMRDFEAAIGQGLELKARVDTDSVRERCNEKIAQAYLEIARDHRNTVSYPKAEKAYREAISVWPDGAEASLELADLVQTYPTRQQEAINLYKQGLDIAVKNPDLFSDQKLLSYRFSYARLHYNNSKYREAAKLFWEVIKQDPKEEFAQAVDLAIKSCRAIEAEFSKDDEDNRTLLDILDKLAAKRPSDDKAHYILGKVYFNRSDFAKSAPYLETALKNMNNSSTSLADARYFLGICYRKLNKPQQAIEQFKGVLDLQPKRYEAICELGELYYDIAVYPGALDQFQRGIEVEPKQYRAFLGGGRTLRRIDRNAEAAVMYEELIKIKDDDPDIYFELGITYFTLNRHEDAIRIYQRFIDLTKSLDHTEPKLREQLAEVYTHMGQSSIALKQNNEANERFDEALKLHPDYPPALNGKGLAYRELSEYPKALEMFEKAATFDPKNPEYMLNQGVVHHKFLKDTAKALQYYMAYYSRGGSDPQVADWVRECGGEPPVKSAEGEEGGE